MSEEPLQARFDEQGMAAKLFLGGNIPPPPKLGDSVFVLG